MNPDNAITAFESELEQESIQERIDSREVYGDDGDEFDPGELKENQDFAQDDGPYYDEYDPGDYFGNDF